MSTVEAPIPTPPVDEAEAAAEAVAAVTAPVEEPVVEEEAPKEETSVLEILEPASEPREVTLTYGDSARTYIPKPLTYFAKMEFFGLLGKTLDEAMGGADGLTVNSILDIDTASMSAADFGDLDSFMSLAAKIAAYAPDFLKDCYLVWLGVPKGERLWAREALDSLGDDDGIAIVETFIDQNWEAIESFFVERVPSLVKRVQARRKSN